MTHQITTRRTLRAIVCCGFAAMTLAAMMPITASAEGSDHPNYRQDRQAPRQQARGREEHRYDGYERRPDAYYSAPPIVEQPYGYGAQPGAALILNFPFFR